MAIDARIVASGLRGGSLLATKLHVPAVTRAHVTRPRLLERLDAGVTRDLVLVCAPAGSGKTALLAEWAQRRRGDTAWLSLDQGDNDPARFWRHLVAAVDPHRPGILAAADTLLGDGDSSLESMATALINQVATDESGIVVVLDDYHHVQDRRVHDSVAFVMEHQPSTIRLVIATRVDPPLGLARLRAGDRLAELRAVDLRFSADEATELLRHSVASISASSSTALAERTEGWAAGLQLAALSLRDQPSIDEFVAGFSGSHRFVLDYLTEEVLEQQPPDVRDFLLETSVLDRLTADLCDAVTGRPDGQAMLERIDRANLFLVPLDDVRGWWRFHHLFADLLRARLAAERPGRVVEIHRAAAAWHDERDLADEAIRHALAAGDALWAARLVERHADARLLASEGATLRRWLEALPASVIAERPRLLLAQANLALVSGDTEAFERPFAAAERALASAPGALDEPYEPVGGESGSLLANVPAAMALGRAHLAELSGDADRTGEFAARAHELLDEDQWMLEILVRAHESVSALLRGAVDEAAAGFEDTFERCRSAGERVVAGRAPELGGLAHRAAGRLDRALALYRAGLDWQGTPAGIPAPGAGRSWVGIAEVEYQRDRLADAELALEHGISLCRELSHAISGSPQPLANALAAHAWLRNARGDPSAARAAMAEAVDVAPGTSVTSLLNPVPALAARLDLAQGDLDAAVRWTEVRGLALDDRPVFASEPEQLLFARVLVARGRADEATGYLDRLAAAAGARPGSLVEIEVLRALALAAGGRDDAALDAMRHALELGWARGWRRVFVDEGEPMAALLGRLASTRPGRGSEEPRRQASALLESFHSTGAATPEPSGRARSDALVEPLSDREIEVLRLLAVGRPNREIADALFVTVDTVKKHVTHILGKLEVANRTEAAARARSLGLLDEATSAGGPLFPPPDGTDG